MASASASEVEGGAGLALVVGLGIAFLQQANGSEAAVYYVPTIMQEAGKGVA
jgi:hypothetical protein